MSTNAPLTKVQTVTVDNTDGGQRLDRWFHAYFPQLSHGRLEKLLRTGQIRVDGGRVKANHRLEPGMVVRVPPISEDAPPPRDKSLEMDPALVKKVRDWVIYKDEDMIAINKPPGLATQGGTGIDMHLDGLLDALTFDAPERPRLVHRLDKDTSGVLVLARSQASARWLAEAFRDRAAQKIYWALVVGVPPQREGKIELTLEKAPGAQGEKMVVSEYGQRAATLYRVMDTALTTCAWLELKPLTGRTHQLRAHCAALGTPIVGDGKYGGKDAMLTGGISRKLHLHARQLTLPRPGKKAVTITAELPPHMKQDADMFGFQTK